MCHATRESLARPYALGISCNAIPLLLSHAAQPRAKALGARDKTLLLAHVTPAPGSGVEAAQQRKRGREVFCFLLIAIAIIIIINTINIEICHPSNIGIPHAL